jgi:hypothetical protein
LQIVVTPEPIPVTELDNDGLIVVARANKASVSVETGLGVPDPTPGPFRLCQTRFWGCWLYWHEHLPLLMQKIVRYGDNIPNPILT